MRPLGGNALMSRDAAVMPASGGPNQADGAVMETCSWRCRCRSTAMLRDPAIASSCCTAGC